MYEVYTRSIESDSGYRTKDKTLAFALSLQEASEIAVAFSSRYGVACCFNQLTIDSVIERLEKLDRSRRARPHAETV